MSLYKPLHLNFFFKFFPERTGKSTAVQESCWLDGKAAKEKWMENWMKSVLKKKNKKKQDDVFGVVKMAVILVKNNV